MRTFLSPRNLKAQLEQAAASLPRGHFITKPENQHLKETWCVAHFGIGYKRHVRPCTVWVSPEQNSDTDFVLKSERGEFPFQAVLSDVPGRRMSDDHGPGPDGSFPVPCYGAMCVDLSEFAGKFASIWLVTNHLVCPVISFPDLGEISDIRMIYNTRDLAALVGLPVADLICTA